MNETLTPAEVVLVRQMQDALRRCGYDDTARNLEAIIHENDDTTGEYPQTHVA